MTYGVEVINQVDPEVASAIQAEDLMDGRLLN